MNPYFLCVDHNKCVIISDSEDKVKIFSDDESLLHVIQGDEVIELRGVVLLTNNHISMGGTNNKLQTGTKKTVSSGTERLEDQQLTEEVISTFLYRLHSNRSLKEVCIINCSVITETFHQLITGISSLETNLRIDLSAVNLGTEGVKLITPLLSHSPPILHSLVMNGCCLGNAGTAQLCTSILDTGRALRNLELGTNGITSSGLEECSDIIRAGLLRGLSLIDNDLCPQSAVVLSSGIVAGCRLTWLSLGHNRIGPDGCEALVRGLNGCSLLWLALGSNKIGDRGARSLSVWLKDPSCELRNLGLSHNQITDTGALFILRALHTNHCSLRYLGLSHNLLSDKSCQILAQLLRNRTATSVHYFTPQRHKEGASLPPESALTPQHHVPPVFPLCPLSKILLAGNLITDFGVALLSGAIAENSNLESLSLADNPFGDEGLVCLGAALSPGNNLSLRSLDIQGSRVTPEAELRFVKMLSDRRTPLKLGAPSVQERNIVRPKSGPLQRQASKLSVRSVRLSFRKSKLEEFPV
ncbi:hypothetical protein LOD99_6847 [Oopsacas minuta]|uniref:Uncharacterized protein n=1 Tax=Oopsacas minuta TaxID=111878 RepID=A0AAV7JJX2_9METZ|nr:hypothetical protein LOD99_6847 [Oopsacas minuta]